jgi:succinoglycan biosynthesis transport protein ExoP
MDPEQRLPPPASPRQPHPPSAAPKSLFPVDSDTHLLDRLNAVYKYRYVVVTVFLLVVLGVLVRTFTTTPMYRATTSVMIEEDRSANVTGFNTTTNSGQDEDAYFQTQLRILTGREVALRAVARLNLRDMPEFNGQGPQRTGLAGVFHRMKIRAQDSLRAVTGASPPQPTSPASLTQEDLVDAFLGTISVEPEAGTRLVNVSVTSSNAAFTARASDVLVEEFVVQNLDFRTDTTRKSLEFLRTEILKQQQKVEDTERAMAEYRETNNAMSLDSRQNTVESSLNMANDNFLRARNERIQKESAYNQVRSVAPAALADSPAVAQNANVQGLRTRLAELQRQKVQLNERYGPKNPQVIENENAIADTTRNYERAVNGAVETLRSEYETALALERRLASALEEQKGVATDLNRKSVGYTVLEREAQSARQIYDTLVQRQNELQIVSNSGGNNIRLMDRAVKPDAAYTPDVRRNLLLGSLAGILLALGLVLAIDYLDDTVKTPEDITRRLKLPFLGLVPAVKGNNHPLLSQEVPHEFGEAFRALRTSLVFSSGTEGTRVIALTSAQPLEGKTTTACNMAIALAYGGSRVLLIDADMRRPSVSRTLGIENTIGLSHLLTGQATARQTIRRTNVQNLWVMTAGITPPNPSELLSSDRMKTLIANVQTGPFDWVLIDTPPVLAVTDAVILAPWVSGVVFVIGSEMTQRRLAERAVETLMSSRPHVLGAVLNRVDIIRNKYYYSRYYGYKYKNYYVRSNAA